MNHKPIVLARQLWAILMFVSMAMAGSVSAAKETIQWMNSVASFAAGGVGGKQNKQVNKYSNLRVFVNWKSGLKSPFWIRSNSFFRFSNKKEYVPS